LYIYEISPNSYSEECFQTTVVEKNGNTHFVFNNFFPENLAVYEIMKKDIIEPERTQMTM
jgi:hypothetical protein